jgi:transposase
VLKLLVKRHRYLGRSKSKAACRLHALLMELEPGGMAKEMTVTRANEILDRIEPATQKPEHRLGVARETLADIHDYETQMKASMERLRTAVAASGTSLVDIRGVGVVVAAMVIGQTGDISRFASAGHLASCKATAPIEASSGEKKRHRLNRRGNRQLNWAIHTVGG